MVLITISSSAFAIGLDDTNIKNCANNTENNLTCPLSGFSRQDADYGINSFDFTKLNALGNPVASNAVNHSCVKDNVTGLTWEVKTNDSGLRDKSLTYTFDTAVQFAASVNAIGLCGFNDWRVPNVQELLGIVDYSAIYPAPAIDTNYFPNSLGSVFRTSSVAANSVGNAWIVNFVFGSANLSGKTGNYHVQLVRGTQRVAALVDNSDGTVTDNSTGLMWAKCTAGQHGNNCETSSPSSMIWSQALNTAQYSTLGGYNDWRLPNIKELSSLVDYSGYNPSINANYFPNTPSIWFWTSTPTTDTAHSAGNVNFNDGAVFYNNRLYSYTLRLVRNINVINNYTVTPILGQGGNVSPNAVQTVPSGTGVQFTLTPHTGYITTIKSVGGDCPLGSWHGNIWTTGAIVSNCNISFNFFCLACLPNISGWRSILR